MDPETPPLDDAVTEVEWHWVKPHLKRDAVILIAPEIGLIAAGERIAANDTGAVSEWIESGRIAKPSAEQIAAWDEDATCLFRTLIVQPYVLMEAAPEPPTMQGENHVQE